MFFIKIERLVIFIARRFFLFIYPFLFIACAHRSIDLESAVSSRLFGVKQLVENRDEDQFDGNEDDDGENNRRGTPSQAIGKEQKIEEFAIWREEVFFRADDTLKGTIAEFAREDRRRFFYRAHLEMNFLPTEKKGKKTNKVPFPQAVRATTSFWRDYQLYNTRMEVTAEKIIVRVGGEEKQAQELLRSEHSELDEDKFLCFFDAVIDCAMQSNFLALAIKKKMGRMNFTLLWNSFPWNNFLTNDLKGIIFSTAELEFSSEVAPKLYLFTLLSAGQTVFYLVDDKLNLRAKEWDAARLGYWRLPKEYELLDSDK